MPTYVLKICYVCETYQYFGIFCLGLPDIMLYPGRILYWSFSAYLDEYWWGCNLYWLHHKHRVVIRHSSLWRGDDILFPCRNLLSAWLVHLSSLYVFLKQKVRFAVLVVVSLFEGATVGPLIQLVIDFEPRYMHHFIPWNWLDLVSEMLNLANF